MSEISKYVDQWLRDAHAMEKQAESILHGQVKRIENYPELAQRMQAHLDESTSQRERLEACLERRGTSASGVKDVSAQLMAMMQNLGGVFAGDEVVIRSGPSARAGVCRSPGSTAACLTSFRWAR